MDKIIQIAIIVSASISAIVFIVGLIHYTIALVKLLQKRRLVKLAKANENLLKEKLYRDYLATKKIEGK